MARRSPASSHIGTDEVLQVLRNVRLRLDPVVELIIVPRSRIEADDDLFRLLPVSALGPLLSFASHIYVAMVQSPRGRGASFRPRPAFGYRVLVSVLLRLHTLIRTVQDPTRTSRLILSIATSSRHIWKDPLPFDGFIIGYTLYKRKCYFVFYSDTGNRHRWLCLAKLKSLSALIGAY